MRSILTINLVLSPVGRVTPCTPLSMLHPPFFFRCSHIQIFASALMARAKSTKRSNDTSANIGFEKKLWLAADSRSEPETAEGNRSSGIAIRGIEADLGEARADIIRRYLRADFVLANGSMSSNQRRRRRNPPRHHRSQPRRLHGRPSRPALLR
jgi:hypothetical protein